MTLRTALRNLRRSPRLSLAAIACISLGAAATSAIATLVAATLLRPLPFPDADRLVRIWFDDGNGNNHVSLSIPDLRDAAALASFDRLLGTSRVRDRRAPGRRRRAHARRGGHGGLFRDARHPSGGGRLLGAADDRPDAPRVVVLSYRTWVARFGASADVVGRTFKTSREVYTIAGVAPAGFGGTVEDDIIEFWMPLPQYEPAVRAAGSIRARDLGDRTPAAGDDAARRRRRSRRARPAARARLPGRQGTAADADRADGRKLARRFPQQRVAAARARRCCC